MKAGKYIIPEQIIDAARKNIAVGLKYNKPGDYTERSAIAKLRKLASGKIARRVIERLENYKGRRGEKLGTIQKLAVLLRVTGKLKRKPGDIQKRMMNEVIDELIMDSLQNSNLSNEEFGRLLNKWRRR